jgi:hypothetical protein
MNNKIKIGLGIFIIISIILIGLKLKGEFSASTTTATSVPYIYNETTSLTIVDGGTFEGLDSYVVVVDPINSNTSNMTLYDLYLRPIVAGIEAAEKRIWDKMATDISNNIASSSTSALIETKINELLSQVTTENEAHYEQGAAEIKDRFVTRGALIKLSSAYTPKPISFSTFDNGLVADYNIKDTDKFYII